MFRKEHSYFSSSYFNFNTYKEFYYLSKQKCLIMRLQEMSLPYFNVLPFLSPPSHFLSQQYSNTKIINICNFLSSKQRQRNGQLYILIFHKFHCISNSNIDFIHRIPKKTRKQKTQKLNTKKKDCPTNCACTILANLLNKTQILENLLVMHHDQSGYQRRKSSCTSLPWPHRHGRFDEAK